MGSFERCRQLRGEAASKLSISGGNKASLEGLATPPNGQRELVRRLRRETINFSALHIRLYRGFPIGFSGSGFALFESWDPGLPLFESQDSGFALFVAEIRNFKAKWG